LADLLGRLLVALPELGRDGEARDVVVEAPERRIRLEAGGQAGALRQPQEIAHRVLPLGVGEAGEARLGREVRPGAVPVLTRPGDAAIAGGEREGERGEREPARSDPAA